MSDPKYKPGWLMDDEDKVWLDSLPNLPPMGDFKPVASFPNYRKPSEWLNIEHQGSMGSCQGQALSSCVEISYYFETGEEIQLSRMYGYIKSQLIDGLRGDRGSTISAGGKVATKYGLPLESLWPYNGRYTQKIPSVAEEAAGKYKVAQAVRLESYEEVMEFLRAGLGAINIGVRWGSGGHAVCIAEEHGNGGVNVANSWGESWGKQGWFQWDSRELKQKMRESYTSAVGITDMVDIEPREVIWTDKKGGFG